MSTTMNRTARALVLAGAFLTMGAKAGSAAPATPDRGTGCFVTDANGQNYFDEACIAHEVTRFGADGSLEFYAYQDVGQLPSDAAHPATAIRNSYDVCYAFSYGVVCGVVVEVIAPGGTYKSSFTAR